MSKYGQNWKRVAKLWRKRAHEAANEAERMKERADFWHTLSSNSPLIQHEREMDKLTLELTTLQTLLQGYQREFQYLLDEDLLTADGRTIMLRMADRIKRLV